MRFTAVDLFCGAGGTSVALKKNYDIKCAIEYDPIIAETYQNNHDSSHLIIEDIKKIYKKEFLEKVFLQRGELDLLIATPPCQGFSKHSKKKNFILNDTRNKLIFHVSRVVTYFHPKFILFENVGNIINNNYFYILLKKLSNIDQEGYPIIKTQPSYHINFQIVNATDYDVPQKRQRLILIAKKIDSTDLPNTNAFITLSKKGIPQVSAPLNIWPDKKPAKKLGEFLKPHNLRKLEAGETDPEDELHTVRNLSELNIRRLEATPKNGGSRNSWPESIWLDCHKKKNVSYGDVYGRMSFEDYAPTITCGCLSLSKGRFGHPTENRAISLREAALIQTFPKKYKFSGSIEKKALQIGNAVPVNLAKLFINAITANLIETKLQPVVSPPSDPVGVC
ncbi:DNA cytosine methyltransferase [Paenibacillus sp. N1-5-1-14]|uniref:DNA cytosine methyltransferase n=1 Tax=Paenibacillus radicibacter TaxID=2972488 RepID=UPI0021592E5A|nr:DNA cytosine methyltransferase [Paenibacillus radicibacter]MCR8644716.1 DNA cytosine methyltransferase [Paenibacillus radicibacter]